MNTTAFPSSLSLRSLFTSQLNNHGSMTWKLPASFFCNKSGNSVLVTTKFVLNCSKDKDMVVKASALADSVAEIDKVEEPSIATMLMNFENKFDPYGSMSVPLYQTATYKQPSATENGPCDYTRSGNLTRDALECILAKLDKADRAFLLY